MFLPLSSKSTLQSESTALTTDFPSLKREKSFGPAEPPPPTKITHLSKLKNLWMHFGVCLEVDSCVSIASTCLHPPSSAAVNAPHASNGDALVFRTLPGQAPPPVPPLRASWLRKGSSRRSSPHAPRPSALLPESTLP